MEISDKTTCLDTYLGTLANYRYLLRRFGRLLEAEGIAPSALTPDLSLKASRASPRLAGKHVTPQHAAP